jgi:predicted CXXCH cytochrome family protein
MFGYLADARSDLLGGKRHPAEFSDQELQSVFYQMGEFEAPDEAITLGVSCEACHLGAKAHAQGEAELPSFFPASPHLSAEASAIATGRTHDNVNWACGRCHTGDRPLFAAGMSTWNSTEYTDAMKGSCYSQLRCIDCHDPHRGIGPAWTRTPEEDDASCLRCHEQFEPPPARLAHTHHPAGSEGSRCMNCHMPRLNEGLQDVVRTHTIFSPTQREMIEANEPNACGLCHTDQTIDWTLGHLKDWYGKTYSEAQVAANYPHRAAPSVVGWLKSDREAVRLVATDAVARQQETGALSPLIEVLNDPYLLNRQFARIALEKWFPVRLADLGYQFYMTPAERRGPIERIRAELSTAAGGGKAPAEGR